MKKICAYCKYWEGNKNRAKKMLKENPISMDLYKGWPEDGVCNIAYAWLTIEINGNAAVYLTVDANFGCVYWSEE